MVAVEGVRAATTTAATVCYHEDQAMLELIDLLVARINEHILYKFQQSETLETITQMSE
jgi:hypothetical protein